jgi:microcystin-dependent protein
MHASEAISPSAGGAVPGELIWFAGTVVPEGAIECLGQELVQADYPKLYEAIGDTWATTGGAAPPAAGNFRLPPSVLNGTNLYLNTAGSLESVGDSHGNQNKSHSHTGITNNPGNFHRHKLGYSTLSAKTNDNQSRVANTSGGSYVQTSTTNGAHTHSVTVTNEGGTVGRPNSMVMKLLIWAG